MVPYSLSVSDLLLIPDFQQAYGSGDKDKIKEILFKNGMETSHGVDEVYCTHRNLRGKVVSCVRYESGERTDDAWLNSGCASLDATIASVPDYNKRVELKMMSRTSDSQATDKMLERSVYAERKKDKANLGIKE